MGMGERRRTLCSQQRFQATLHPNNPPLVIEEKNRGRFVDAPLIGGWDSMIPSKKRDTISQRDQLKGVRQLERLLPIQEF